MTKHDKLEHYSGKLVTIMEELCRLSYMLGKGEEPTPDNLRDAVINMLGLSKYETFSELHNLFKSIYNSKTDTGRVDWSY